jgi:carotenoid cleavage dioxygenase
MSKPFPKDHPFLTGYYAPLHLEADAVNLPISGTLPPTLRGSLYRIGPNPQFAPRGHYDWFAGDGMLHEFQLGGGRASYRNRYVRTPKWELEHAEGESLSAGSLAPSPLNDPRLVALHSTVANTHVVWHGGRLLALEEVHAPFELDPGSLGPKGYHTHGGDLVGPFTAHPKIDPVNGELLAFGYQTAGLGSRDVRLHIIGPDGNLRRSEHFMAPYASVIHDFCPTQNFIVLPIFPLTGSLDRARRGLPAYAWEPELGNRIGVMPRQGPATQMRWFRGEACYVFHPLNAYDTPDGKLVLDMVKYDVAPGYALADGRPALGRQHGARLVRWTIDLTSDDDRYVEQALSDVQVEYPRIDERFALQAHRHGWFVSGSANANLGEASDRASIAHVDTASGSTTLWQPPAGDFCGEAVFVPRHADAAEGEGWLLSVVYRGAEHRSDLAVFEALNLERGPVALIHLSHRVPAGIHGSWRDAP